jgi:hypothetical protein
VRSLLHSGASETQFILFFSTASEAQVALHLADRLAVSPSVRIAVVCAASQNLLGRLRFVRFVKPAVTSLAPEMLDGSDFGSCQPTTATTSLIISLAHVRLF